MPVWHASVALLPIAYADGWPDDQRLDAALVLRRMLRGVGRGENIIELPHPTAIAIHVRRLSTADESNVVGGAIDLR